MNWIVIVVFVLVAAVASVVLVGYALPERHTASVSRTIPLDLVAAATRIRDVDAYPKWRSGAAISAVSRNGATVQYTETQRGRDMRMQLTEREPGRVFVSTILSEDLSFSGEWIITLSPTGGGTDVTIVENGAVRNPVFRFVSYFVIGQKATMTQFLDDLEKSAATP